MIRKRRNTLRKGHALLLQDNAPQHRAGVAMATIEECGLQLLEHPLYSPDLAPSDIFPFPEMKRQLKGRRFEDRDNICAVTEEWLLAQPRHFYFLLPFKDVSRSRTGGRHVYLWMVAGLRNTSVHAKDLSSSVVSSYRKRLLVYHSSLLFTLFEVMGKTAPCFFGSFSYHVEQIIKTDAR